VKVDFKKEHKNLYSPKPGQFTLVEVPAMQYLMVDGKGDPNKVLEYKVAVESLFSVSYTLKFHSKKVLNRDYVVPPLEGLWWSDNYDDFRTRLKEKWSWTMMIMVPDWLGHHEVDEAIRTARARKPNMKLASLRLETLDEGLSAQIMHIGSYDEEAPTLKQLHEVWLPENGLKERLKHHEIYIGDPRKTEPSKLKTVLRQPVSRVSK
jgi:hypothetical protein